MNYEEAIKDVKELSNLAEWYESDVISDGYEEAKKHREDMTQRVIKFIEKEHELLGLKNEQLSIFQFERNHFCSMTDESYERLKALDLQIKALEEELK